MGKSAPSAPDPYATAAAQQGENVNTAIANAELNRTDSSNPWFSQNYSITGYNPDGTPNYAESTTLSPTQQTLFDQSNTQAIQKNNIAGSYLDPNGALSNLGKNGVSFSNVPQLTSSVAPGALPSSIAPAGSIQTSVPTTGQVTSFNPGGPIQGQIDTSGVTPINPFGLGAQQSRMMANAVYGQEQPFLDVQQKNLNNQLVNEGVQQGSEAWDNAQMPLEQQENLLYSNAQQAGMNEQQSLYGLGLQTNAQQFGQAATEGNFANTAQAQQYGQNQGEAAFTNQALQNEFGQNLQGGEFANSAQQQQFGQNNQEAQFLAQMQAQGFSQGQQNAQLGNSAAQQQQGMDITQQTMPLTLYNAFSNGTQVQPPGYQSTQPVGVQGTNLAGLVQDTYNAQLGSYNSGMSGLYGLGGTLGAAAIMASDRRLKKNVVLVGKTNSGIPVYRFEYLWSGEQHIGCMADEVAEVIPDAVITDWDGIQMVDYGMVH